MRWRLRMPTDVQLWEIGPALLVIVIVVAGIVSVLAYAWPLDLELAYRGGQAAWSSGHPERVFSWISTPFLGMIMALVSRVVSVAAATLLLTLLNLAAVLTGVGLTWRALRGRLPRPAWWLMLIGTLVFAPIASTLWWKQFNVLALGLALAGFLAERRGRSAVAGPLIALSISLKPIVILLPFALLTRRDSRKAGFGSLLWLVVLSAIAQGFMAWRAHDLGNLSPVPALTNFAERPTIWACDPENFSPGSLLCRVSTGHYVAWQRPVIILAALLLILMANDAVRRSPGRSWEIFAFACLLSPMVSPTAWSHFQILLLPMLVFLAYLFVIWRASLGQWISLAVAYGLAELTWRPLGTLPGAIEYVLLNRHQTLAGVNQVMAVGQFAQYLLFLVAVGWFYLHWRDSTEISV